MALDENAGNNTSGLPETISLSSEELARLIDQVGGKGDTGTGQSVGSRQRPSDTRGAVLDDRTPAASPYPVEDRTPAAVDRTPAGNIQTQTDSSQDRTSFLTDAVANVTEGLSAFFGTLPSTLRGLADRLPAGISPLTIAGIVLAVLFLLAMTKCTSGCSGNPRRLVSEGPVEITTRVKGSNDEDGETSDTSEDGEGLSAGRDAGYVYLYQLESTNQSDGSWGDKGFYYYDAVTDNFGTTYSNGIGGDLNETFEEYGLDGTYSELRGRVVLDYDARTYTNEGSYLLIYGDGINLFVSQEIKAGCEPQDFTVDLTGVSTLKVVIEGNSSMLRLVDCALYVDSSVPTASTASYANKPNASSVFLSNLDWFNASNGSWGTRGFERYATVKDNFGTTYENGIGGDSSESFEEYRLDGTYSELRGRVVLDYDARTYTNEGNYLTIYGDGILLFRSQDVVAGCEPQDFTVDLTGVSTLKVVIEGNSAMLRLVDCALYTDSSVPTLSTALQGQTQKQSRIYLSDLDWFNASNGSWGTRGFEQYTTVKDNFGTTYANGLGGDSSESFEEFRLDGAYSELRGRVVLDYDARTYTNEGNYLTIYGDGILLFRSQDVVAGCEPQDFTVDLTGVKTLKVVIEGNSAMLRLVDCILYV